MATGRETSSPVETADDNMPGNVRSEAAVCVDSARKEEALEVTSQASCSRAGDKRQAEGSPEISPGMESMPPHLAKLVRMKTLKKKNKSDGVKADDPPANYAEALEKVNESAESLKELREKHGTTHTDIKNAITRLELVIWWLSEQDVKRNICENELRKNNEEILEQNTVLSTQIQELTIQLNEKEANSKKLDISKETVEVGTETISLSGVEGTVLCSRCNKQVENERVQQLRDAELAQQVEDALDKAQTMDDLASLVNKEWPKAVFKNSAFARKSFLRASHSRAMLVTQGSEKDKVLLEKLKEYPSAASLINLPVGGVAVLRSSEALEMVDGACEQAQTQVSQQTTMRKLVVGMVGAEETPEIGRAHV